MKVLVVGTGGSIVSGISTAADEMTSLLVASGHTVERLTAGASMRRRPNALNMENIVAVARDAWVVFARARRTRADIVWLHTFGVPALPAARALALVVGARLAGCRAIVRFHAFALEETVAAGGPALRLVLRALARLSSSLVAEHEPAARALAQIVPKAKVAVLYNWVRVPTHAAPLPPSPPLRAVFVGGVVRRKGAPQLIDAMRLLDDVVIDLRLVGGAAEDGPAAFDALRASAQDLVDAGRVTFVGELDALGVRAELARAHLFVLPSRAEGMPLAMLEALAEGRPVLVGDAGNMAEIVRVTGCGVVLSSQDPAVIAAGLRNAAADPGRLEEQGRRGRQAALDQFSEASAAKALSAILGR